MSQGGGFVGEKKNSGGAEDSPALLWRGLALRLETITLLMPSSVKGHPRLRTDSRVSRGDATP